MGFRSVEKSPELVSEKETLLIVKSSEPVFSTVKTVDGVFPTTYVSLFKTLFPPSFILISLAGAT